MRRIKNFLFALTLVFCVIRVSANNIKITNVKLSDDVAGLGYSFIEFDLSWDNSWRVTNEPNNWDAAWVFAKYRVDEGEWQHVWLNDSGHNKGSGTNAVIEAGLLNDMAPFSPIENPGVGAMIFRSGLGVGTFNTTGIQLRWNYLANGVPIGSGVEVKVFAIEMVLVPGGSFWVGDGVSYATFRGLEDNSPYQITENGMIIKCESSGRHDPQLEGLGIWLDGDEGISKSSNSAIDMNPDFPTGYHGFYCMKYEISQGQYRDFLNTLTKKQQNHRTSSDLYTLTDENKYIMTDAGSVISRNSLRCDIPSLGEDMPLQIYCDYNANGIKNEFDDGEWIACNYLSWADGAAYMDWSGLRPLSELEYEKVCRGPLAPISGEFVWGTNAIVYAQYSISDEGTSNESISIGYSNMEGNAGYNISTDAIGGPLRVGIFAANSASTGRVTSGAGYYGAMEMGGNLYERVVSLGHATGREFNGTHGDGKLKIDGDSDATSWPEFTAIGSGIRGGSWRFIGALLRISDRDYSSSPEEYRSLEFGFRGCRSVAPNNLGR